MTGQANRWGRSCFPIRQTTTPGAQGSAVADEAIRQIAKLYAVEKQARGLPPDKLVKIRQINAKMIFESLDEWLAAQLPSMTGKSPLAAAIRYALTRMARLRP